MVQLHRFSKMWCWLAPLLLSCIVKSQMLIRDSTGSYPFQTSCNTALENLHSEIQPHQDQFDERNIDAECFDVDGNEVTGDCAAGIEPYTSACESAEQESQICIFSYTGDEETSSRSVFLTYYDCVPDACNDDDLRTAAEQLIYRLENRTEADDEDVIGLANDRYTLYTMDVTVECEALAAGGAGGLPDWAIALIVIAVVISVLICCCLIVYFFFYKPRKEDDLEQQLSSGRDAESEFASDVGRPRHDIEDSRFSDSEESSESTSASGTETGSEIFTDDTHSELESDEEDGPPDTRYRESSYSDSMSGGSSAAESDVTGSGVSGGGPLHVVDDNSSRSAGSRRASISTDSSGTEATDSSMDD